MNSKFETFIENLLLESLKSDESKCDSVLPTGNEHINKEFRLILDRMATALIHNTFDNERLVKALMKLSSTERIVIVFNIVLGMQMSEISYLLNISMDNVYARKYRGINLLREYINADV